jgi:hypothetical protein
VFIGRENESLRSRYRVRKKELLDSLPPFGQRERTLENLVERRYLKPLGRAGIATLKDLIDITPHDLLAIKGAGYTCFHQIVDGLMVWDIPMRCIKGMTFYEMVGDALDKHSRAQLGKWIKEKPWGDIL